MLILVLLFVMVCVSFGPLTVIRVFQMLRLIFLARAFLPLCVVFLWVSFAAFVRGVVFFFFIFFFTVLLAMRLCTSSASALNRMSFLKIYRHGTGEGFASVEIRADIKRR